MTLMALWLQVGELCESKHERWEYIEKIEAGYDSRDDIRRQFKSDPEFEPLLEWERQELDVGEAEEPPVA